MKGRRNVIVTTAVKGRRNVIVTTAVIGDRGEGGAKGVGRGKVLKSNF